LPTGDGSSIIRSNSSFFLIVVCSCVVMLFFERNVCICSQKSPAGAGFGFSVFSSGFFCSVDFNVGSVFSGSVSFFCSVFCGFPSIFSLMSSSASLSGIAYHFQNVSCLFSYVTVSGFAKSLTCASDTWVSGSASEFLIIFSACSFSTVRLSFSFSDCK